MNNNTESEINRLCSAIHTLVGLRVLETEYEVLKARRERLRSETLEQWQRDDNPHLVAQLRETKLRIEAFEQEISPMCDWPNKPKDV